jgi:hypothetical protein
MSDSHGYTKRSGQSIYASWTGRFPAISAVVKESGTDAWLWQCKHSHQDRTEAMACALQNIEERVGHVG